MKTFMYALAAGAAIAAQTAAADTTFQYNQALNPASSLSKYGFDIQGTVTIGGARPSAWDFTVQIGHNAPLEFSNSINYNDITAWTWGYNAGLQQITSWYVQFDIPVNGVDNQITLSSKNYGPGYDVLYQVFSDYSTNQAGTSRISGFFPVVASGGNGGTNGTGGGVNYVPIPSSLLLLGSGLTGFAAWQRMRRQAMAG